MSLDLRLFTYQAEICFQSLWVYTSGSLQLHWDCSDICINMQYLYLKLLKTRGDLNTLIVSCQEIGSQWIHCHSPGWFPSWSLSLELAEPSARLGRLLPVLCLFPLWNTWFPWERAQQLLPAHCRVSLGSKAASNSFKRGVYAQRGINFHVSLCCCAEGEHLYPERALPPVLGHTLPHRLL